MPIPMAYIAVVIIWSTTPLAMKWSTEGVGFLFGVTGRMCIGAILALVLCCILRIGLPLHIKARQTYLASGSAIYAAMLFTYWGAQYIPSGWIAVIFGMSPVFTSIMTSFYTGKRSISITEAIALVFSLLGLIVMFQHSISMGDNVVPGIIAIVVATLFYSLGLVTVKIIDAQIKSVSTMTGTIIVAVTLYLLTWFLSGSELPVSIPTRTAAAILYLGVIASVIGFMLFFYVLKNIDAIRVSLITLITPGCALILGNLLNHEPLTKEIWLGTSMVLCGLLLFQYEDGFQSFLRNFKSSFDKPETEIES